MRSDALVAVIAISCSGCPIIDPDRPIGVVSDGLSDADAANLAEAAQCWNLEFGTQFVVGAPAESVEQQVVAFYDRYTCLQGPAQVQTGWPDSLAICPHEYSETYDYGLFGFSPFRILSHELGHVLNIVGHPDASYAVLGGGGDMFRPMFADVDHDLFHAANPDFVPESSCGQVTRSVQRGTHGSIGHCACDMGPFDLDRPIAIVPAPEIESARVDDLVAAVGCWNLHYGTTLAVRPAEVGDQVAYLEPFGDACPAEFRYDLNVARDGDEVLVCTLSQHDATFTYALGPMADIARALGVKYAGNLRPVAFTEMDDQQFEKVYPGRALGCPTIVSDETTGVCSCGVAPSVQAARLHSTNAASSGQ